MQRNLLKPSPVKKSVGYAIPTKDDMPMFLKGCKAFKRIPILEKNAGAIPYAERVLGWKIKCVK